MNAQGDNEICIVEFQQEHTRGIVDLIVNIQRNEFGLSITASDQPDLLNIAEYYQRNCGNFWVAECDGCVVGTISLLDIGNRQGALRKMFVDAAYRGAQIGTAHKLLATSLQWARRHDLERIYLGTTPKFLAAHRFYEKHGFAEIPQSALPPTFPVMHVDTRFYMYEL